jgi:hypothetical protein
MSYLNHWIKMNGVDDHLRFLMTNEKRMDISHKASTFLR